MVGRETRESQSLSSGPVLGTKAIKAEATGRGERHGHPGGQLRAHRAAASAAHAKSKGSGRDRKQAETAAGGERDARQGDQREHARQGDQLRERRSAAYAAQAEGKAVAEMESELWPLAAASVTSVRAIS
jgi:hypothetical protein